VVLVLLGGRCSVQAGDYLFEHVGQRPESFQRQDDLPRSAKHEEIYYFRMNPPEGFGSHW